MNSNHQHIPWNGLKSADEIPFDEIFQPGDRIIFGQACSEPASLMGELLDQGPRLHSKLGKLKIFVAGSYSGLIKPEHARWFDFFGYGAIGDSALLARQGLLEVFPMHYSQLPEALAGIFRPDVMLMQLSGPDETGRHSLGAACDFQLIAARKARVVIAEVNARAPFAPHALLPDDVRIDYAMRSDRALVEAPQSSPDEASSRIAAHVASLIPDRATLQMGVGNVMDAICRALASHQGLGIHSGVLTDGMADLMAEGVVTNAHKGTHVGQSVVGSLLGTRRLFDFAHNNSDICLSETDITHGASSLSKQLRLCAINSAIEVDLTGQVNAEMHGDRYIGAVGGQVDFVRAAARSPGGLSIIALPSAAKGGSVSRIVSQIKGPVTTPRSDIDYVVTEWGIARLRGCSLRQRARAMVEIAHPDHRAGLLDGIRQGRF
jgi:acetyl-CoA hydrolase